MLRVIDAAMMIQPCQHLMSQGGLLCSHSGWSGTLVVIAILWLFSRFCISVEWLFLTDVSLQHYLNITLHIAISIIMDIVN